VYSDRDEFDERYRRARQLEQALRIPEAIAEYDRAIELYRGDFLVEDLYEEWPMIERERLVGAYMSILNRLADHQLGDGQYAKSIETCYRALKKDPCHEGSYRLLMECYARQGLRATALRQYALCKEVLTLKYDAAPSPETQALYRSLQNLTYATR
jgi:two-component SAPR family response regulator